MARFYKTSAGEYLEPFDPGEYGYGKAPASRSSAKSQAAAGFGEFDVLPQDVSALDAKLSDYQTRIDNYAYQIQQNPKAGQELMPEIQKLSAEIASDVRAGDIYHMLLRKKTYDEGNKNLGDVFEESPDYMPWAKNQIVVPPLKNEETGEYQNVVLPNFVQPWTADRESTWVKDSLAQAIAKVTDEYDFDDLKKVGLDEVSSIFYTLQEKGISFKDVKSLLVNNLSTQDILAIQQEGERLLGPGMGKVYFDKVIGEKINNLARAKEGITDVNPNVIRNQDERKAARIRAEASSSSGSGRGGDVPWLADAIMGLPKRIDPNSDDIGTQIKEEELYYSPNRQSYFTRQAIQQFGEILKDNEFKQVKDRYVVDVIYDPEAPPGEEMKVVYEDRPGGAGGGGPLQGLVEYEGSQIISATPTAGRRVTVPLDMSVLRNIIGPAESNKVYEILKQKGFVYPDSNKFNWWGQANQTDAENAQAGGAQSGNTQAGGTQAGTPTPQSAFDIPYGEVQDRNGKKVIVYEKRNPNLEDYYGIEFNRTVDSTGTTQYEYPITEEFVTKNPQDIFNPDVNIKDTWIGQVQKDKQRDLDALSDIFTVPEKEDNASYTTINPVTGEKETLTGAKLKKLYKEAIDNGVIYRELKDGTVQKYDRKQIENNINQGYDAQQQYYEQGLNPEQVKAEIQKQEEAAFDKAVKDYLKDRPDYIMSSTDSIEMAKELGLDIPGLTQDNWASQYAETPTEENWKVVSKNMTNEEIEQKQIRELLVPDPNTGDTKYKLEKQPDGTFTLYERG
jgi:hypothetical protein